MHLEQYPKLLPTKGMVFECYMSRNDVGSGIRMFVVTKVGRKWVHLFYAPQLIGFAIRPSEWGKQYIAPVQRFNSANFKANVMRIASNYDRGAMQYSKALVTEVLALDLDCALSAFALAGWKPSVKEIRS